MFYYRIKPDSSYAQALSKSRSDQTTLLAVADAIRKEFNLPDTNLVSTNPAMYYYPPGEVPDELQKQFKKDGFAKKNSAIAKRYVEEVGAAGLADMKGEPFINFAYGIMRTSTAQTLRRMAIEGIDYIETDCEFSPNELSHLDEITEVEFYELRVEALKKTNAG